MGTFNVWDKVSITKDGITYAAMVISVTDDTDPIYGVSVLQTQTVLFGTQSDLSITSI